MAVRSAFATKSRFEILNEEGVDDVEDTESEEEVEDQTKESNADAAPAAPAQPSKAAAKKEARQRKKAAAAANGTNSVNGDRSASQVAGNGIASKAEDVKEGAKEAVEQVKQAASDATDQVDVQAAKDRVKDALPASVKQVDTQALKQKAKEAVPEQVKAVDVPSAKQIESTAKDAANGVVDKASALASQAKETIQNGVEQVKPAMDSALSAANETAGHIMAQPSKAFAEARSAATAAADSASSAVKQASASTSASLPKAKGFAPKLPADLPASPASKDTLPADRKRKPTDLPAGSPQSKGVKFQDGLLPGEGKDGEKIIRGVDRHEKSSTDEVKGGKGVVQDGAGDKKSRNAVERTIWTFVMIGGFIGLLCMGHPYMILLVMLCQTMVYKEVTALFALRDHGGSEEDANSPGRKGDAWTKTLNWYFFVVTNYFLYGESIIYYFKHIVFIDAYFLPFAKNHRFISFMLYIVGFVAFVANLQKQYLRQQFALFCWVHMSLLVIVVSSHFIVNNILEGLIWFFVPASLVICNDVMAYICGKLFGKTPLIKLSPKKTVEGFVGAFLCTLLFGLAWGTFFQQFQYMICPAQDLGVSILSHVKCNPNPVFLWRPIHWPHQLELLTEKLFNHSMPSLHYTPFQLHTLVMATFASLVAPFGGFFASGFKRAFNIKDFGHSIPGHGGMTDRMDCQFMMGLFSYVYYSSLIRVHHVTVGSVLQTIVSSLTVEEQVEVLVDLKRYLDGQGVKLNAAIKALGK